MSDPIVYLWAGTAAQYAADSASVRTPTIAAQCARFALADACACMQLLFEDPPE